MIEIVRTALGLTLATGLLAGTAQAQIDSPPPALQQR